MPEGVGAVLMIGHFIVSIFNVQLGQPVIYSMPFDSMKSCEYYANMMPKEAKIDIEWKHITRSQCFTTAQFKKMMEQRNGITNPGGKPVE
jgi:hypothetical protein